MERKHSGKGIASFAINIMVGTALLLLAGIISVSEATPQIEGVLDYFLLFISSVVGGAVSHLGEWIAAGFIGAVIVEIIALYLGWSGLAQKERKKVFAVLGTILSILGIIVLGAVMLSSVW